MSDADPNETGKTANNSARLHQLLDAVCDKNTFLNFASALALDAADADTKKNEFSPNGWEHGTIGSFLDALVHCADGKPDRFPEEPSWKTFAEMLHSGKVYE